MKNGTNHSIKLKNIQTFVCTYTHYHHFWMQNLLLHLWIQQIIHVSHWVVLDTGQEFTYAKVQVYELTYCMRHIHLLEHLKQVETQLWSSFLLSENPARGIRSNCAPKSSIRLYPPPASHPQTRPRAGWCAVITRSDIRGFGGESLGTRLDSGGDYFLRRIFQPPITLQVATQEIF